MIRRICSCSLLLIISASFCYAQSKKFSSQDGFVFPGEAERPTNFPLDPNVPTGFPSNPNRPTNFPLNPTRPTDQTQPDFQRVTSTVAPETTTVFSIQLYAQCLDNCLATNEYNPVCGTDNVVYSNPGRLGCARNCGNPVSIKSYGQCNTGPASG